ncbi:hypothetical protein [Brachybacterium endophyticum]|nr:hypothetical protein [Brachybacterium endophyticum]
MAAANLLGLRLRGRSDDVASALDGWEETLRPYITKYQKMGRDGLDFFTPASPAAVRAQSRRMARMRAPIVSAMFSRFGGLLPQMRQREVHLV